jgi:hypothetical protein
MITDLLKEIDRFRKWADGFEVYERSGEWEMEYDQWTKIYTHFSNIISHNEPESILDHIDDILFIIARDNECEVICSELQSNKKWIFYIARNAINSSHSDAKWQIAKVIANFPSTESDELIYKLSLDRSTYVQRVCAMELAKMNSNHAKELADYLWLTGDLYCKISALWCLYWSKDPRLNHFLSNALKSNEKYLLENAHQINAEQGGALDVHSLRSRTPVT